MIDKFAIAKALNDEARNVITPLPDIELISEGEQFTPKANKAYIKESVLFNTDNAIGLGDNSSDISFSIYQLMVITPRSNKGAKWQALALVRDLQTQLYRGLTLQHNGQKLRIKTTSVSPLLPDKTHFTYALSINFSAIG